MRSMYARYPEYHTSLDDLSLVTPSGLQGGYNVVKTAIQCIELNEVLSPTVLCEPQVGKRGLYPTISKTGSGASVKNMMNFLAYVDGQLSNIEIAEKINVPLWSLASVIDKLKKYAASNLTIIDYIC